MNNSIKQKADILHEGCTVIDAHFDILMDVEVKRALGYRKVIETQYLQGFKEGGVDIIVASLYVDGPYYPDMCLRKVLDQISSLYAEIDESPDKIMLCKNCSDMEIAKAQGKLGIILSFEGAEPLYNDMGLLRIFYELGVRIVGLVWSRRNYAGDGSHFKPVREGKRGGLTDFGVSLVEEAEKLGMFIDVSHLNDEGFEDVMEIAKNPVIASHSDCRAVVNVARNLTDEQIRKIAQKGGVIGMNVSSMFVSNDDKTSDVQHLADHVDHIVNLVGAQYVGLGFDFCDQLYQSTPDEGFEKYPRKPFDVIKGHGNMKELTEELLRRGYSDQNLKLILGENFLRVYRKVLVK